VKIYCIEDCNGLKYVGSTKQKIKKRFSEHKYCRSCRSCSSWKLDLDNCKIYVLEETDEEHRQEREQYWIDNTECVNYLSAKHDKEKKKAYWREYNKTPKRKEYTSKNSKYVYHYRKSWGGDLRCDNNNLLKIDVDLFR